MSFDVFALLHGVIMRLFVTALLIFSLRLPASGDKQQSKAHENQVNTKPVSAQSSPVTVVVGQLPAHQQTDNPQGKPQYPYEWFWPPIWSNWGLILVAAIAAHAALKTLGGIDAQVIEMRKTGEQTDKLIQENIAQSRFMADSVRETARFATAMEGVAGSLKTTAAASGESVKGLKQQMRAYVTTGIGGAVYQERDKNTKFVATVLFINNGLTPARQVRHKSKAAVLSNPLPPGFDYPLAGGFIGETIMAPRQSSSVHVVLDDFIDDSDVASVKSAKGKGLYVWGRIEYEDISGDSHYTIYCHLLYWITDGKDEKVWGTYISGHNDGS